jgi:hypothetical protein
MIKQKPDYCECCMRGGVERKPIKLYNTEGIPCDCLMYICDSCRSKKELFDDFLEMSAQSCGKDLACGVING